MLMKTPGIGDNSEMARGNWIAVDRDLRYHEIVGFLKADGSVRKNVVVCETMAWIDLIMEANWKDRRENNNGKVVLVERGQLIGARAYLAKRWGWTQDKVRYFLKKLEDNEMIARAAPKFAQEPHAKRTQSRPQRRAHFANIITICNYDIYQTVHELDDLLRDQSNTQSTPNQHPHSNKRTNKQGSVPNGTGAEAPAELRDFRKILWEDGLAKLREYSCVDEIKLRRRVGRWVKDYSPGAVIDTILKADKEQPVDALSWIEAVLRRSHGDPGDNLAPWERKARQDAEETRRVLEELKAEREQSNG